MNNLSNCVNGIPKQGEYMSLQYKRWENRIDTITKGEGEANISERKNAFPSNHL